MEDRDRVTGKAYHEETGSVLDSYGPCMLFT